MSQYRIPSITIDMPGEEDAVENSETSYLFVNSMTGFPGHEDIPGGDYDVARLSSPAYEPHKTLPNYNAHDGMRYPVSSPPKRSLLAPNALHLHLDTSSPTSPSSSPSTPFMADASENSDTDPPAPTTPLRSPPRVRFRSRVRITSGLPRGRRKDTAADVPAFSESSLSSSPSSSISAPLRSRADDEANKPGWGPLGRRVSFLAFQRGNKRRRRRTSQAAELPVERQSHPTERTPLTWSAPRPTYVADEELQGWDFFSEDGEEAIHLNREIDAIFGKWPGRLLNLHWWWWQLEPVVCCHWGDDSDREDE